MRGNLGERCIEQREIRQEHRAHQHDRGGRQHHPAPAAEPHDARLAILAADHRIAAPAEHHVLGAQQDDGEHQERQRGGGGELRLGWKLEQAPDLGGHGVEAGRHRQDRRRAEQRHRLQERHQRPGQHRRQCQRDGDAARGIPGLAAENGGGVLEIAGRAVERIGDQHKDIREGVAADDEHQPREAVDIEQMRVRRRAGDFAKQLVEQPAVGRGQQLPGDGAEERRGDERRRHQDAHGAAQRHVGARHQPAHRRRHHAADQCRQGRERKGGEQRIEIGGVRHQPVEIADGERAVFVGEGVVHQPRQRHHDQPAQDQSKRQQYRLRKIDPEFARRRRCWNGDCHQTLKISEYRFLIASACAWTPSASSFISLMSASLRTPGFSTVWPCDEYWRA